MKAGIITYHNVINYGAALQALALQETLQKNGADAQILNYTPKVVFEVYRPFSVKRFFRYWKDSPQKAIKDVLSNCKNLDLNIKKRKAFSNFGKQYFQYSGKPCADFEKLCKNLPEYDLCFTGSDQVWNPDITRGFDPAYFLDFGKQGLTKASYAASIGRDNFSEKEKTQLAEHLKRFDFLSLREKSACKALEGLTEKPFDVVLDPTLLLKAADWEKLLNIKRKKGGYILVYTLYPNAQLDRYVEALSKEKGLPVVTFTRKNTYTNMGKKYPCADPRKFVELFAGADYVATNSFHGTAFSVNMGKNFVTFTGSHRNARILDLLGTLGISERAVAKYDDTLLELPDIDYASVEEKLNAERERSIAYIKTVLERAEAK